MFGRTRLVTALAVAAVGTFGVAACGSDESNEDGGTQAAAASGGDGKKELKLGHFGFGSGNFVVQAEQMAMEAAAKKDGNVSVTLEDGNFDAQQQARQMQDALTSKKYDGWMIGPVDGSAITGVVKKAIDAGIKVTAYEFPLGPDPMNATEEQVPGTTVQVGEAVVPQTKTMAEDVSNACAKLKANPCRVAAIYGNRDVSPFDVRREEIFKAALKDRSDIKLLASLDGNYEVPASQAAVKDAITRHGRDGIDVIACFGDQMCVGAEKAYKTQGISKVPLLAGLGTTTNAVDGIKRGVWWSSLSLLPQTQGKIQIESLIADLRGEKIPYTNPMYPLNDYAPFGPSFDQDDVADNEDFKGEWTVPG
jgi:ribose transport system substrate-binding protein